MFCNKPYLISAFVTTILCLIFLLATQLIQAQTKSQIIRFSSSHTSFPDSARMKGHDYDSVHYSFEEHYNDSSVVLVIPPAFHSSKKIDLIFWFHGWGNNIDTALEHFQLQKQFEASGKNAILVLAETTHNAPDSYGGKLEKQNEFALLVKDIVQQLQQKNIITKKARPGNIVLAGHSGAYRVMASMLKSGGVPVREVYLFDALYTMANDFITWVTADDHHRFIDIYTDGGGTDKLTKDMMVQLQNQNKPFIFTEEDTLNQQLPSANILFIHSRRKHNDIINNPDNFLLFLQGSKSLH